MTWPSGIGITEQVERGRLSEQGDLRRPVVVLGLNDRPVVTGQSRASR